VLVIPVDSIDDLRLHPYTGLTDVARRSIREPAEGIFVAEGAKVIRRAVDSGLEPISVMTLAKWLPTLVDVVGDAVPVYVVDETVAAAVSGFRVHRGALAVVRRPTLRPVADVVRDARRIVILEDLVEHSNVGAVVRCAAALGFDAVLVSPRCADPLYRRAVKVSMGTVFQVPWTRADPWPEVLDDLTALGFELVGLTPGPGSVDIDTVASRRPPRLAVVLGTEGDGLGADTAARCSALARIPMRAGVDSLNVAAAAAVAFYALAPR